MQVAEIREIVIFLFFSSVIGSFVFFVYGNLLYLYLKRKYDKLLFKEPYFSASEIAFYSNWPFSLVKGTGYILLITGSSIAKKRFKDFSNPIQETVFVKFLCYTWVVALIFILSGILLGMVWGGVEMLLK